MSSSIKLSPSRSGLAARLRRDSHTDLADQQAFAEALASADILTNGTKWVWNARMNHWLMISVLLHPGLLVTECVYNPHMTKLLQQAQQAG